MLSLLVSFLSVATASPPLPASDLLVEYMARPVIDTRTPRFFWLPQHADRGAAQSAYQLKVSTAAGALAWDSNVVTSNASTHIAYGGAALTSNTEYVWTVTWWDSSGAAAPASAPGAFSTGLFTQAEWAPSQWVGCPLHVGAVPNYNQLRAEFSLGASAIVSARAYVAAVGYAALRVNGREAPLYSGGYPINSPGWTTYEVRALYATYDVAALLTPGGSNALALWMANGWPDIGPVPGNRSGALRDNEGGNRQVRMQVHVTDATGATTVWATTAGGWRAQSAAGGAWMCGAGALLYDNIYNGVTWDQTLYSVGWDQPGFAYSANWTAAVLRADPGGAAPTVLTSQAFPDVTVQAELPAQDMWELPNNVFVFDFAQNLAGVVRLRLPAPVPAGVVITMRHAELLQHPPYGPADGSIYVGNLRSAKATDVYTTGGAAEGFEEWAPPIGTYHGFRFVEVSGLPFVPDLTLVTALFFRTGVEHAGNVVFPPGDTQVLNQLQHAVTWGIGCNLMSVVSDCPQRDERKGWMGDSGLSLQPTHYNYAMGAFYTAWAANIRDAQTWTGDAHPVGSVPDTVPHTFGSYPSDPAWGTAYPGVVHSTWRMLGDTRIAADHYPNLQMYVDFMMTRVNNTGIGKLYQSYGDWCPPGPKPPDHYTSGVAFLVDLQRMVELATALGKPADASAYASLRASLIAEFNAAWLGNGGIYGNQNKDGLQTANAAALGIGAVGAGDAAAVAAALTADVVTGHGSHWSVGIIGMRFLHAALTDIGAANVALDTLLQTSYPSYGYWFSGADETAATTLWELPDAPSEGPGMNSRNHHMFASVGGWLYEDLAGIDQVRRFDSNFDAADPSQVAFRHAVLMPRVTAHPSLPTASATYRSVSGPFSITWRNANATTSGATCAADAPENAPVALSCPAGGVFQAVDFASFGTPSGNCGAFAKGACDAANTTAVVSAACLGKNACSIDVSTQLFGDPCCA